MSAAPQRRSDDLNTTEWRGHVEESIEDLKRGQAGLSLQVEGLSQQVAENTQQNRALLEELSGLAQLVKGSRRAGRYTAHVGALLSRSANRFARWALPIVTVLSIAYAIAHGLAPHVG